MQKSINTLTAALIGLRADKIAVLEAIRRCVKAEGHDDDLIVYAKRLTELQATIDDYETTVAYLERSLKNRS